MKKRTVILISICAGFLTVGILAAVLLRYYRVTTVYVEGNIHYDNEEIMEMVMTGRLGNNSLYLAMK